MSSMSNYDRAKHQLAQRYFEALQNTDLKNIYSDGHHSGIFLPAPHESYFSGSRRVFIVGQETRGWRSKDCEAKQLKPVSFAGVLASMESTISFNLKKPRTSKFRQFYKSAAKRLCTGCDDPSNAALWSNQFCISYKGKNAVKSPNITAVQDLSFQILRAQFEVLKPDLAIFTTGHGRDTYLKQCFAYETVRIHEPKRLWEFRIGDVRCFRTNHPSWGGSNRFLLKAIRLAE